MWNCECYWNYYGKCGFDYVNYLLQQLRIKPYALVLQLHSAVYTFGGAQLDATVSDLPAGLTSVVSTTDKTVTISGTLLLQRTYTITTSGHYTLYSRNHFWNGNS
jgi:hypothetical protein